MSASVDLIVNNIFNKSETTATDQSVALMVAKVHATLKK